MHDHSFLAGLELGKFLTRLKRVEDGLAEVRRDLHGLRRIAILGALWVFALLTNVSADRAAEIAVDIIASAVKK